MRIKTVLNRVHPVKGFVYEKTRIRRGVFRSVPALEKAIDAYLEAHNAEAQPFAWTATADEIFNKIEGI